jgi:protein-S-isoprenylcysteine O-methyltransferase Ste14
MRPIRANQVPLLNLMVEDLRRHGTLRKRTAALMWTAYGAHATATGWALIRRPGRGAGPTASDRAIAAAGTLVSGGGLAVAAAGMGRFAGTGELTGTQVQTLTTSGVYQFTRNPQYLGYVAFLAGLAIARRSGLALGSTAFLAVAYDTWIRAEEAHLVETHGQPYRDYLDQAPRWSRTRRRGRRPLLSGSQRGRAKRRSSD